MFGKIYSVLNLQVPIIYCPIMAKLSTQTFKLIFQYWKMVLRLAHQINLSNSTQMICISAYGNSIYCVRQSLNKTFHQPTHPLRATLSKIYNNIFSYFNNKGLLNLYQGMIVISNNTE